MLRESPIPMPVILLTVKDEEKIGNITTLIWIGFFSEEPLTLGVTLKKKRYSYKLLEKYREFGINIPTIDIIRAVDFCGYTTGRKIDKFRESGLTPIPAHSISAPMIKECPIRLECRLKEIKEFTDHDVIIGEVVYSHIEPDVVDSEGKIDFNRLKPIIGNYHQVSYYEIGDLIEYWGFSRKQT